MRPDEQGTTVRSLLLTRRGLVFAPELNAEVPGSLVHGVELELAGLGYVLSPRLTKICPELMTCFASRARPSMLDLALLHAAARCRTVIVRGNSVSRYTRRASEDVSAFCTRLRQRNADQRDAPVTLGSVPLLAVLFKGDIDLPKGSSAYALFREQVTPSLAASDLLS